MCVCLCVSIYSIEQINIDVKVIQKTSYPSHQHVPFCSKYIYRDHIWYLHLFLPSKSGRSYNICIEHSLIWNVRIWNVMPFGNDEPPNPTSFSMISHGFTWSSLTQIWYSHCVSYGFPRISMVFSMVFPMVVLWVLFYMFFLWDFEIVHGFPMVFQWVFQILCGFFSGFPMVFKWVFQIFYDFPMIF